MLDQGDEKKIQSMIFDGVVDAMEQVLFPRLDNIEGRLDSVETRLGNVEEKVDGLMAAVEILDSDMSGVKIRLTSVEKKLDGLIDNTFVVQNHEKRISKLERAII